MGASLSSVVFDDDDDGGWRMARMHASSFLPLASMVSAIGGGVCNPHTTPFPLIHPPPSMGGILLKMMGRRITHTPPPRLTSFTPPLLGVFFSTVVNDDGDGAYSTRRLLYPPH